LTVFVKTSNYYSFRFNQKFWAGIKDGGMNGKDK